MKKHLVLLAALALSACSRNPDPEYAPEQEPGPTAIEVQTDTVAVAASAPVVAAPAPAAARLSEEETMRLGREAAALIFAGDIDALWPRFDAQVQAQAQSADNFAQLTQQVFAQIGEETNLVEEEVLAPEQQPGLSVYRRRGHYMTIMQDANLLVAFNADGTIAGVNIQPAQ